MPQGSVLLAAGRPGLWSARVEEIQVDVLNDDSARAKAPGGSRRSGGWTTGRRPRRLPLNSSPPDPPLAANVDRVVRLAWTSRASSTDGFRPCLQGQRSGSTQLQPQMARLRSGRSPWRRKVACREDFMVLFERIDGLLWSYALNLTPSGFQELTVRWGEAKVPRVHAHKNSVRPLGRTSVATVCPIASLAGKESVAPFDGRTEPLGGNGPFDAYS